MEKKKNILIVDDSALMRRLISDIIKSDNRFDVEDLATNGLEALDLIVKNRLRYDAVILDINMPKMNGLELLEQLQKNKINITVIVVSTLAKEGARETIIAMERGAFDFVTKPENYLDAKNDRFKQRLLSILCVATKLVYDVSDETIESDKNSRETGRLSQTERRQSITTRPQPKLFGPHKSLTGSKIGKKKLIALACSTGGPKSLQSVIPLIPEDIDAPIVIVQHMPKGFTNSLAARLDELSRVRVKEAQDGDMLQKGYAYIAPGGCQLRIEKRSGSSNFCIKITDEPARDGLKPCANIMYESLVGSEYDEVTCVVLTGMGADGTIGIGTLSEKNNVYVIAQDEATSVVYGMPKSVAEAKLVDEVKPLEKVAEAILKNVGVLSNGR